MISRATYTKNQLVPATISRIFLFTQRLHGLTSIDNSAAVIENYSALVQGRNRVEEVEGSQIPLKLEVKYNDSLFHLCIL